MAWSPFFQPGVVAAELGSADVNGIYAMRIALETLALYDFGQSGPRSDLYRYFHID